MSHETIGANLCSVRVQWCLRPDTRSGARLAHQSDERQDKGASKKLEQWLGVTQLGVHNLVVRLVTNGL